MYFRLIIVGLGFCLVSSFQLNAQEPLWASDIAPIIFDNCVSCHHDGGIAPFSLTTYEDCVTWAYEIHHETEERIMPPWPADPNYQHFVGETYLSDEEILLIHDWVYNGQQLGNPNNTPPIPEFPEYGSLLESIDFTVQIPAYTLQSNIDEYRWFVIETDFSEPVYISKLEVIPGQGEVVHHADLFYDLSGQSKALDEMDPLPGFNGNTGYPSLSYYINAWQPGGNVAIYPEDWGIMIPPGADLVVEVHYGPGGIGLIDDTKMNLQFIANPVDVRGVKVGWLLYDTPPVLIDGPLVIPANEIVTFHQVSAPLTEDISLISICPHMHFLGKSYRVWYESPEGDSIPLVDIPQWDLHWQKYYTFQYVNKIPAGSILKSEGVYDNTLANHDNPFNPPQTAYKGLATTDEMFLCYFIYSEYEEGDEFILMDSTLLYSNLNIFEEQHLFPFIIAPNPADETLQVFDLPMDTKIYSYRIFDSKGQVFKSGAYRENEQIDIEKLPKGVFILELLALEGVSAQRFIKY